MHATHCIERGQLGADCIAECSAPGSVDSAVEQWQRKLDLTVDRDRAVQCLRSTGGWSREELEASSDEELAQRVLWLACGSFDEDPEADVYWVEG